MQPEVHPAAGLPLPTLRFAAVFTTEAVPRAEKRSLKTQGKAQPHYLPSGYPSDLGHGLNHPEPQFPHLEHGDAQTFSAGRAVGRIEDNAQ